jgi:hypothetical protein
VKDDANAVLGDGMRLEIRFLRFEGARDQTDMREALAGVGNAAR